MAIDVTARAMAANADSKAVTAYEIAVQEGYTGSEQDFADDMALLGTNASAVNSAVRFDEEQNKTSTEQLQAQSNIGLDTSKGDINTQLANKANIDGSYDGMTSGLAGNFISNTFIEDAEPYNFRTSGGSADVGDREYLENLVGGTLALNQYVKDSFTGGTSSNITVTVDGHKLSFDGTADAAYYFDLIGSTENKRFIAGHKYYMAGGSFSEDSTVAVNIRNYDVGENYASVKNNGAIFTATNAGRIRYYISTNAGSKVNGYIIPQLVDLTALFGTIKQNVGGTNYNSIADYVYSLGQDGSIAWLYKYFPKLNGGYIPYSAPKLESVCTNEHITVGFNQWDEVWEQGIINAQTGENVASTTNIRSKDYIRVVAGSKYYIGCSTNASTTFIVVVYDINKKYVGYKKWASSANEFDIPSNAYYLRFSTYSNYSGTYNNDICLNLAYDGERDGEYSAYVSHTYPMGHETLRGVYMLDANGNLYLDPNTNDVKVSEGEITRRWGISKAKDLTWVLRDGSYPLLKRFQADELAGITVGVITSATPNVMCNKYDTQTWSLLGSDAPNGVYVNTTGSIFIRDTNYNDATAFTASFGDNDYIIYPLATPTTESGTPYTYVEVVDNWGTERFTDYGVEQNTRAMAVPVGHVTKYPPDLKAKLEMSPESPDGDGDYIVRQSGGENSYVLLPKELPNDPSGGDGTYSLVCTVSGGVATKSWVADA